MNSAQPIRKPRAANALWLRNIMKNRCLLYMMLLPLLYYLIFHFLPMYGVIMAFKDYKPVYGKSFFETLMNSPWVGMKHILSFIRSYNFLKLMRNTVLLFLFNLLWSFPWPIFFALMLNELRLMPWKKTVQTISYLPHFISVVSLIGMLTVFVSPRSGFINRIIEWFGGEAIYFLTRPEWFRTLYIASGIWQGLGWGAIIYIAAISTVDLSMFESARIDGASRWKCMWYITLPAIKPTIVITLIMSVTGLLGAGGDKVILMYNPATYETADVISSYVYRRGLVQADYSFSAAVGMFTTVINALFLVVCNRICAKLTEYSMF